MDLEDFKGLDTSKALSQEQIKLLQAQASALLNKPYEGQGGRNYTSIAQPIGDVLSAISGRNLMNQANTQQNMLQRQAAGATANALPSQTQQEQLNNKPQTSIDGYAGPVPPLHQVPNKEAIANYALQLSPEARERYLEKVQELAKPVHMEVDNGTLVGNPVTQKWAFQPKTDKAEQEGTSYVRKGSGPFQPILPGVAPGQARIPVPVKNEAEFMKQPKGTKVQFPDGTYGTR